METNFAYASGDTKLFPLCYMVDGNVDRAKTIELIKFALDTFDDVEIPASQREVVRHQIEGAAQSYGVPLAE